MRAGEMGGDILGCHVCSPSLGLLSRTGRDAEARGTQDGRSDPGWLTMRANNKLSFAFAKLLQESKVSVTEISSQRVLPQIKLDRFREICHGGRQFTTPEDKVILYVQDWIS